MLHVRLLAASLLTGCLALPALATAQPAAPTFEASSSGSTVTASWSAVPGATGYRVEAGLSPTIVVAGYDLGLITSFTLPEVPQGTYYMRVRARDGNGLGAPSNGVAVTVHSDIAPPAPPTNFAATVVGNTVTLTTQLPAGPLTGLLLAVGVVPDAVNAVLPLTVAAQNTIPNVPPGVVYGRLIALNAGGQSAPSNEVQIVISPNACVPPAAPVVSAQVAGQGVLVAWNAVAGAAAYRLDVSTTPGGAPVISQPLGPSTTSISNPAVPPGTYFVRVSAGTACGLTATSAEIAFTVNATQPGSNRTPNPPSGQALPLPNRYDLLATLDRAFRAEMLASCGNNAWLFRAVQRLRQEDTRWGLNWKRGRVGDMSQDVITYNYGPEADEGTRNIYVIDVIAGHCGASPRAGWINVTGVGGADAIWTLQPYTAAGFPR